VAQFFNMPENIRHLSVPARTEAKEDGRKKKKKFATSAISQESPIQSKNGLLFSSMEDPLRARP